MDFSKLTLFSTMKSKLEYHSARQSVLARNIANADTPDYQAQDVATPDFKRMAEHMGTPSAQKLPIMTTNAKHISASQPKGGFKIVARENTYELSPTGNNVVIEEEAMKVAENQAEYQKVLSLYRKSIDLFKTAIGRPGAGG